MSTKIRRTNYCSIMECPHFSAIDENVTIFKYRYNVTDRGFKYRPLCNLHFKRADLLVQDGLPRHILKKGAIPLPIKRTTHVDPSMRQPSISARQRWYCDIKCCSNYLRKRDDTRLFRVPEKRSALWKRWEVSLTAKNGDQFDVSNVRNICQLHFNAEDIKQETVNGVEEYVLKGKRALPLPIEPLNAVKREIGEVTDAPPPKVRIIDIDKILSVNAAKDPTESTYQPSPLQNSECASCFLYNIKLQKAETKISSLEKQVTLLQYRNIACFEPEIKPKKTETKIADLEKQVALLKYENKQLRVRLNANSNEVLRCREGSIPTPEFERCELCHKRLAETLINHHVSLKKQNHFLYLFCAELFQSTKSFLSHLKTHENDEVSEKTENRVYKCDQCPAVYPLPVLLQCHAISHDGEALTPVFYSDAVVKVEELDFDDVTLVDDDIDVHNSNPSGNLVELVHELKSSLLKMFKCGICQESFDTAKKLGGHLRTHEKPENSSTQPTVKKQKPESKQKIKMFKCGKCESKFETSNELRDHIRAHDGRSIRVERQFECYLCKQQSKTKKDALKQMKLHARCKRCSICHEPLTERELDTHLCNTWGDQIKCEFCPNQFNVTKTLLEHLDAAHSVEKRLHRCNKCSKFLPTQFLRDFHQDSHADQETLFACKICPKRFATKTALYNHIAIHSSKECTILCDECGKGFRSQQSLNLHKKSSTHAEPTIQCPECPKKFYFPNQLGRHMDSHSNIIYICDVCGLELQSLVGYNKHKQRHGRTDADRKFACKSCPKKFFDSKSLKTHQAVHTGLKQFYCRFCSQSYKYRGDLNKHLKTHLGEKIHECDMCNERFQYPNELRKHKYEHYKKEKEQGLAMENGPKEEKVA